MINFRLPGKLRLALEFAALFAGAPAALAILAPGAFLLPVLWVFALICLLALRRDPFFNRARLSRVGDWRPALTKVLLRFAVCAVGMAAVILAVMPGNFLRLVRDKPLVWMLVMIFYPLLSVLPQGIVYRAFLFHRYRGLVSDQALLIMGAIAFSLAHLPFGNAWALGFTLIGGFMFGDTYLKSRSMLISCFEHALYGCLVFTIGFGAFFFHGTPR